jgi:hypothetical protein
MKISGRRKMLIEEVLLGDKRCTKQCLTHENYGSTGYK